MSDELKPCPFCGKSNRMKYSDLGNWYELWCGCEAMPMIETRIDSDSRIAEEQAAKLWNRRPIEDELAARIAELESQVDDLQGELAQSSAVSRIVELEADRDRLREALISAKVVMDYFGESMNNMDIVTDQDEAAVNPLFEAVDEALDTIPDYKEKFDNGLQQAYQRAEAQKENYK